MKSPSASMILCAALFLSVAVNQAFAQCPTGSCIDTTQCANYGGTSQAGLCPGATNIQCCHYGACNVNGVSGTCKNTAVCSGTSTPGYCPGPAEIQCCTGSSSSGGGSSIVDWGRTQVGKIPYSWGGGHGTTPGTTYGCCSGCGYSGPQPCPASSTNGFDCSGFTRWAVWKARGSDLLGSGSTSMQETKLGSGRRVTRENLQPGDLIYYGAAGSTYHTAIYVGATQLEAPQTGQMVSEKTFRAGDRYYRV